MEEQLAGKNVPWNVIELYESFLEEHRQQISRLMLLKHDGILTQQDVETRIPKPMLQLYNMLHKTLTESEIVKFEKDKDKKELVLKTIMSLQNTLVKLSTKNILD
jgi:hypothetical protein